MNKNIFMNKDDYVNEIYLTKNIFINKILFD